MKYVALLRGINVGGNKTVSMAALKTTFESLGCVEVRTYINSGNVIFSVPGTQKAEKVGKGEGRGAKAATGKKDALLCAATKEGEGAIAALIEKAIQKDFGFEVRVLVCSDRKLHAIARSIPASWTNDIQQRTDVLFLWQDFDHAKSAALVGARQGIDTVMYVPGALIWHLQKVNHNKSGMRDFIGTEVYKNMTGRNVNTVRKLADMVED